MKLDLTITLKNSKLVIRIAINIINIISLIYTGHHDQIFITLHIFKGLQYKHRPMGKSTSHWNKLKNLNLPYENGKLRSYLPNLIDIDKGF